MDRPLEITFHNFSGSPALEAEIREHVAHLEKFFDHLIGCRVAVELRHQPHRKGNIFEVHIVMHVPGAELAVSREPHRPKERYASPDVHTSLRDAFKAAQSQLVAFKKQIRREVKPHPAPVTGQVTELFPERDYGFLLTAEGGQLYFHRNSMMNGDFDKLKIGDRVHFVEATGDTGPTASKVWLAAEPAP